MAVLAKAPVPGRVKTRLCPPLTPAQAAELARAALLDTIEACSASAAREVVVILDGSPRPWMPAGIRVIAQRQGDLGNRLLGAVVDLDGRCLVVGMDTPSSPRTSSTTASGPSTVKAATPSSALLSTAATGPSGSDVRTPGPSMASP